MAITKKDLYIKCWNDPQWESVHVSKRPLRGPQAEIVQRLEKIIAAHEGDVATCRMSRQVGKNDMAAVLQRRHLWRRQRSHYTASWIRTAPTYKPQIINSKKRLKEIMRLDGKRYIKHPLFPKQKLVQEEGYIWRLGQATVEFISSGPNANVVGATASTCLDMDEAHKVDQAKFDEDFAPFTASTNAASILWGVASNGLDTISSYVQKNKENGKDHLNLHYPCEVWMEVSAPYRAHVEARAKALGWDHPIMKTQYRLLEVAAEGKYLQANHVRALFSGDHERALSPRPGKQYQAVLDIAAGNEDFNPESNLDGDADTSTDSTILWIYEVSPIVSSNGIFPIVRLVNLYWWTGANLPNQQEELEAIILQWGLQKVTVDSIGVGRQMAEGLTGKFGNAEQGGLINSYVGNSTSISEDLFDLQARLNFSSVLMFKNDQSPEYLEFERQVGWTKYASAMGKMKLVKPATDKHIDMVKALTYINRNAPAAGMHEMYSIEGEYT